MSGGPSWTRDCAMGEAWTAGGVMRSPADGLLDTTAPLIGEAGRRWEEGRHA